MPGTNVPSWVPHLDASEYQYELPIDRIAKFPVSERSQSRLLHWDGEAIHHRGFDEIAVILDPMSLLVFNNSKVIPARMQAKKSTGGAAEILCLEPLLPPVLSQVAGIDQSPMEIGRALESGSPQRWRCLVGGKRIGEGERLHCSGSGSVQAFSALVLGRKDEEATLQFEWTPEATTFSTVLAHLGELPIPPYMKREIDPTDRTTYQTVYAKNEGSVAAPTAGLHFTSKVLEECQSKGIKMIESTLHVGMGTFKPMKTDDVADHSMHREQIQVSREFLRNLLDSLVESPSGNKRKVVAVGTTALRVLESLNVYGAKLRRAGYLQTKVSRNGAAAGSSATEVSDLQIDVGQWDAYEPALKSHLKPEAAAQNIKYLLNCMDFAGQTQLRGDTALFVLPGFEFGVVDQLITNFHQPKSTLILLVASFVGQEWKRIYQTALTSDYRFLSYGDSSLLSRSRSPSRPADIAIKNGAVKAPYVKGNRP